MKFVSESVTSTNRAAKMMAHEILNTNSLVVIGFIGNLGTGKTTFIKSLIKGLGYKKRVTSPTFLVMRKFSINKGSRSIYHIDAYRVLSQDLMGLGFKNILKSPNIVLVEWADRIKRSLPKKSIYIKLEHSQYENERYITFNRR